MPAPHTGPWLRPLKAAHGRPQSVLASPCRPCHRATPSPQQVLYAVSKPWPVVLATLVTCITLGKVPSLGFIAGITLSVSGIALYYFGKGRTQK